MYVIKNISQQDIDLENEVKLKPGEQLDAEHLTPLMEKARDAGRLQVKSGDPTDAERRADAAAFDLMKNKNY